MNDDLTFIQKLALDVQECIERVLCTLVEEYPNVILQDVIDGIVTGMYVAVMRTPIKGISCEIAKRIVGDVLKLHNEEHKQRENISKNARFN